LSLNFASQLPVELGSWQLGQVPFAVTTGSFTGTANPSAFAIGQGGVTRIDTAVLGTIRLGIFQLGQIPFASVTSQETEGKGSFLGSAFPSAIALPTSPSGSFTATGYPSASARGNFGPIVFNAKAFPSAIASPIIYYADGSFTCTADPTASAQPVQSGAFTGTAYPNVEASPILGQDISCLTGPNPPIGSPPGNFVY
jgi:hypothetical protein